MVARTSLRPTRADTRTDVLSTTLDRSRSGTYLCSTRSRRPVATSTTARPPSGWSSRTVAWCVTCTAGQVSPLGRTCTRTRGVPPARGGTRPAPLPQQYGPHVSRVFQVSFASVYPAYLAKVERKGRTRAELHQVVGWLTGFDEAALQAHLASGTTLADFFAAATLPVHASLITGTVCGVRVEEVEDPLMQKIRYLDKLVDELAGGRSMDRVLRA